MIEIVSATRLNEEEFWARSPLGLSLRRFGHDPRLLVRVKYANTRGLPELFNAAIKDRNDSTILIFVHDDVWIDDDNFIERVTEGLNAFDIIGVAGNQRGAAGRPAWCFIDEHLTWDSNENLSGRVAHGPYPLGEVTTYGETPAQCELLDGVLIAASKATLTRARLYFDPTFHFHFYDLDFCRNAAQHGLKLGTWPIELTHQSGGAFGTAAWQESYCLYQRKWDCIRQGVVPETLGAHFLRSVSALTLFNNFRFPFSIPTRSRARVPIPLINLRDEAKSRITRGNRFLAEGSFKEAAECYGQALALDPADANIYVNLGFALKAASAPIAATHYLCAAVRLRYDTVDAHYLLGKIAAEANNYSAAVEHLRCALELKPDFELACGDLSLALLESGDREAAKQLLLDRISQSPDVGAYHYYLGNLHVHENNLEAAAGSYSMAVSLLPDSPEFNYSYGRVLEHSGALDRALACYQKVLSVQPSNADVHCRLGELYKTLGDVDHAMMHYREAQTANPALVEAHTGLGALFQAQGRLSDAIACYRQALALNPASAAIQNNLAVALKDMGRLDEAAACFREALILAPDFAEAYNNYGNVLKQLGNTDQAVACYHKALELNPRLAMAHLNLGVHYQNENLLDEAVASYRQALELNPELHHASASLLHILQYYCDWEDLLTGSEEVRKVVREMPPSIETIVTPFVLLALPGATPMEQKICATKWVAHEFRAQAARRADMGFVFSKTEKQRLHIGYLSADFRRHPVAQLMAEVFELHDRGRFRITAYSYGIDDGSAIRRRLQEGFDRFVDIIDLSEGDAATRIYHDQVDILVDLTGYTHNTRSGILALRPAPIQVSYIGYLGTMGADFVDYIIADRFLVPPESRQYYVEKVAYLDSYQANDRKCVVGRRPTRESCGLPNQGVVFCCFNQTYKITPDIFTIWMRLLLEVSDSVLWLYASNERAVHNLRREAEAHGVAPERLIFAEALPLDQHLARLQCADLFLDTQPYNAGTTASNALWAGLPVVTCAGNTFASRMAGSVLTAMGIPELITYGLDQYYDVALQLALDGGYREALRAKLAVNRDTALLFDSPRFTRDLERAYLNMWHDYNEPSSNM